MSTPKQQSAHEEGKPWVLDPVAIGMGQMRTELLTTFKAYKPSIIRGNASEIIALAGLWGLEGGSDTSDVRGVDSTDSVRSAAPAAVAVARWTGGAVAISGEEDLITDGRQLVFSQGGSEMMPCITGTGCSLGGVMAVYAAVADPFIAAITGSAVYNLAGTRAAAHAKGTGSFQTDFIDELYVATPDAIAQNPLTVEERHNIMNTLIAVAIAPCGTGDEFAPYVAEIVRIIRRNTRPDNSMFTEIEGEWDDVMAVVKKATQYLTDQGLRAEVVLKADIRLAIRNMMFGETRRQY